MQFLFVDRIITFDDTNIQGVLRVANGPYTDSVDGESFVSFGFISEAIGQLASWLCLERTKFTKKPVFLFCPEIEYGVRAKAGEEISIKSTIDRMDDESLIFSGIAETASGTIASIKSCNCHLMPLDQLEDIPTVKERFTMLQKGQWQRSNGNGSEEISYDLKEIDDEIEVELKNIDFVYADHFPKMPVTPIVVLNEVVYQVLRRKYEVKGLSRIKGIKIRNFVKPGEAFQLTVKEREGGKIYQVDMKKDGKHVMRGLYEV